MIYDELPSSWRFVDDEKKLFKHKGCYNCSEATPIVTTNLYTLPSFIYKTSGNFFTPLSFDLHELTSGNVIGMASEIPNMELFTIGNYTYVALNKTTYTITPLQTGVYQAQISDGVHTIYSEPIEICDSDTRCVQFNWTNTCDLAGIPYGYLETAFGTPFLNTFSITDMSLLFPEYETEKEKFENMLRQTDNFYLNQTRTFSVKHKEVPDWFVRSIQVMQLHDTITVVYDVDNNHQNGLYTTDVEECSVVSNQNEDADGPVCSSTLEIKIRQDDAVITTLCCVNSEPDACLESCYDVIGFISGSSPSVGDYAIDDVDSGVIKQWNGSIWITVSSTCTYVFNETDSTYLFYDGDLWQVTPDITSINVLLVQGDFTTIQIFGYTMPGTWVYVGSSSLEGGCNYEAIPFTAEQLAAGQVSIVVNNTTYYYVCIKSENHNCIYDARQIHFDL